MSKEAPHAATATPEPDTSARVKPLTEDVFKPADEDHEPNPPFKSPTEDPSKPPEPTVGVKPLTVKPLEVVISGAGPAGLLLAHYLLEKGGGRFRVSLFDRRDDPRRVRDNTDPGIRRLAQTAEVSIF